MYAYIMIILLLNLIQKTISKFYYENKKRENNAFFLSFFGYLVYCVVACCGYSKQQTTYAHRGLTGPFLHILDDEFLMHCSNIVVTTTVVVCGLVLPLLWYFYGQKLFPLGYNEAYLTFTILERTSNSVRKDYFM